MTNKEIIDGLKMTMELITFDPSTGETIDPDNLNDLNRMTYDACNGAIEALKGTNGDTISRHMAIDAMTEYGNGRAVYIGVEEAVRRIENLPPAQPERPKGEWTATYSDCGDDVWVVWKCSECGYVRKKGWDHTNDGEKPDALFCEMCNADMRGEQT